MAIAWGTPKHSSKAIDRAGKVLRGSGDGLAEDEAVRVYDDWRTLHEGAITHFRPMLVAHATAIDPTSIVVSRLKRLDTVRRKLDRSPTMALSKMEDVGGLRVVLQTAAQTEALAARLVSGSAPFIVKRRRDYIADPQASGYRGLHLVFTCPSDAPEHTDIRGLAFEVQLRSRLQHVWATAVEAAGAFRGEDLKSSIGDPQWLRLFVLAAASIADHEGTPQVPSAPVERTALLREIADVRERLDVEHWLSVYRLAPSLFGEESQRRQAGYFVLQVDRANNLLRIYSFKPENFESARTLYRVMESWKTGTDIVLVAANSLAEMEKGYPNYYADTTEFINLLYERERYLRTPLYVTLERPDDPASVPSPKAPTSERE